jgi:hypothetical protein
MEITCYCGFTKEQKPEGCDCELKSKLNVPDGVMIYGVPPWALGATLPSPFQIEAESRRLAVRYGYAHDILTDGTILLEPPPDPNCCGMCEGATGFSDLGFLDENRRRPQPLWRTAWGAIRSVLSR